MPTAVEQRMWCGDEFAVWDGVYADFAAAPASGPGFEGSEWCARSVAAAHQAQAAIARGDALDYSLTQRNAVLPPLAAALLSAQPSLRVLDIGGGPGLGFLVLKQALAATVERVDYTVFDNDAICAAGRDLFGSHGPAFRDSLPGGEPFDIVHAASVLQYVEDWKAAIAAWLKDRPRFLSMGDVFAGPFGAYVTLQVYYGSRIRHWMLNLDDVIGEVARHGYGLAMRVPCHVEVLGRRGALPMDNLPAHLRLPHTHHLLFARDSVSA